jgi:hypothetical protein
LRSSEKLAAVKILVRKRLAALPNPNSTAAILQSPTRAQSFQSP